MGRIENIKHPLLNIIEIDERLEIFLKSILLLEAHYSLYQGVFYDITNADGIIKNVDISKISLEHAEKFSSLLQLGPDDDGNTRRFIYKKMTNNENEDNIEILLETKSIDSEPNYTKLSELTQSTFPILASIFALPIISYHNNHKKLGILFREAGIDVDNWDIMIDYLNNFCKEYGIIITLLVSVGRIGRNEAFFSEKLDRIGIYSEGRFLYTNSYQKSLYLVRGMVASYQSSNPKIPFIFFLGAGASIGSGVPPTRQLMERAMREKCGKGMEYENYEALVDEYIEYLKINGAFLEGEDENNISITFERIMTEELANYNSIGESSTLQYLKDKISESSPSTSHYNIIKLLEDGCKIVFITTNYDDLIEKALNERYDYEIFYLDENFQKAGEFLKEYVTNNHNIVPVFKLHGTIHNFNSIKASVAHTLSLEPYKNVFLTELINGVMINRISKEYKESIMRIIFIGYGFGDKDIINVLRSIKYSNSKSHIYIVNPNTRKYMLEFTETKDPERFYHNNSLISMPFTFFSRMLIDEFS